MKIGYSTGAAAFGDFRKALELLLPFDLDAIELSAIRTNELQPLVQAFDALDLSRFEYVAVHAPSRYSQQDESNIVESLTRVADNCDAIIVHPDTVIDNAVWRGLKEKLCFENMDKRKPIGRTARELDHLFDAFPEASLCLDLGHAWQIDRTMCEARQIIRSFRGRIRQIHVSEVNTQSAHVPLTIATVTAFRKVAELLPSDAPWIIESVTDAAGIVAEIAFVRDSFAGVGTTWG